MSQNTSLIKQECYDSGTCPVNSVCVRNLCVCKLGYYNPSKNTTSKSQCMLKICNNILDCQMIANTACTGINGTCVCSREFELDTTQACTLKNLQNSPWRSIASGTGASTIVIFCVIFFIIRKQRIRNQKLIKMPAEIHIRELQNPSTSQFREASSIPIEAVSFNSDIISHHYNASHHQSSEPRPIIHHFEPPPGYEEQHHSFDQIINQQASSSVIPSTTRYDLGTFINQQSTLSPLSSKVIGI